MCMLSYSVVSDSLQPPRLQPSRLLCPWGFPGKSAGVGCHCLLQCPYKEEKIHTERHKGCLCTQKDHMRLSKKAAVCKPRRHQTC